MRNQSWMWVLWPSFLAACALTAAVFAIVDPLDIRFFGHLQATRYEVYTGGFFLFWLMSALSSALTLHISPRAPLLDEFGDPIHD